MKSLRHIICLRLFQFPGDTLPDRRISNPVCVVLRTTSGYAARQQAGLYENVYTVQNHVRAQYGQHHPHQLMYGYHHIFSQELHQSPAPIIRQVIEVTYQRRHQHYYEYVYPVGVSHEVHARYYRSRTAHDRYGQRGNGYALVEIDRTRIIDRRTLGLQHFKTYEKYYYSPPVILNAGIVSPKKKKMYFPSSTKLTSIINAAIPAFRATRCSFSMPAPRVRLMNTGAFGQRVHHGEVAYEHCQGECE